MSPLQIPRGRVFGDQPSAHYRGPWLREQRQDVNPATVTRVLLRTVVTESDPKPAPFKPQRCGGVGRGADALSPKLENSRLDLPGLGTGLHLVAKAISWTGFLYLVSISWKVFSFY